MSDSQWLKAWANYCPSCGVSLPRTHWGRCDDCTASARDNNLGDFDDRFTHYSIYDGCALLDPVYDDDRRLAVPTDCGDYVDC